MVRNFAAAAAWEAGDDLPALLKTVFPAKQFPRLSGLDVSNQGMPDELHGHTSAGVERFFERKNAERLGKAAADEVRAPGPPGPELRANEIDVANAFGAQLAREAKMKAGKVCE